MSHKKEVYYYCFENNIGKEIIMKPCKLCQLDMEEGAFDYCEKCRTDWKKPSDRFYYLKKRQTDESRQESTERSKKWIKKNYEYYRKEGKRRDQERRYAALLFYSNSDIPKCVHCGETNINVLALDHIHNDAKKDNANRGGQAGVFHRALKIKDKSKYQTLCYNCNWKKHIANLKSKWKYEKVHIRLRKISHRYKTTCIAHYSNNENKCCKCGNNDMEVLCLDHINDDGNIQRKEIFNGVNTGGKRFYGWLIKNSFPSQLQVLCMNCNIDKQRVKGISVCSRSVISPLTKPQNLNKTTIPLNNIPDK